MDAKRIENIQDNLAIYGMRYIREDDVDFLLSEIITREESLSFWKKDSAMVTAALHRAEEEVTRLEGENEKYKQALETLNVTALLTEITRLEGENERYAEALDRIIQGTADSNTRRLAIEARHGREEE